MCDARRFQRAGKCQKLSWGSIAREEEGLFYRQEGTMDPLGNPSRYKGEMAGLIG
jgi:hypothetical protein